MQNRFSFSVNIIRDKDRKFNYLPTPNTQSVITQISNDFKTGIRSFNIIGSYGTGKSSLLWAFQRTLEKKAEYFQINLLNNPRVRVLNIIGEYRSIRSVFADYFNITSHKNIDDNIFTEIYSSYRNLGKTNPLLIIQIDEFGKFLEYAAQNEPEDELYFIQKLTEFVNNPENNILLITTVHQNFEAYATSLTVSQKQEWIKVKGRLKEIAFNEPVEQLLFLASEHIKQIGFKGSDTSEINKTISLYQRAKAFEGKSDSIKNIATSLYPLDIFSANIITTALQRYGQNERSLFTFLNSNELSEWKSKNNYSNPFYHISHIHDYLINNFYSFIASRNNPDYVSWQSIKIAIEQAERYFDSPEHYITLIKCIGLLNIFASAGAALNKEFLCKYSEICLGIKDATSIIETLEKRKVILFRNYSNRFILFEGTDLDIHLALNEAGNKVSAITDVTSLLKKYYNLPPILAKEITCKRGTPRLFEYKISTYPLHDIPEGEIDGYINLIFNENLDLNSLLIESKNEEEAILYCFYANSKAIKDLLFEIEKTQKVIEDNLDDRVALRELQNIVYHQKNLLNHKILNNFYSNKEIVWVYKGKPLDIHNKKQFNRKLSEICREVYEFAPVFNNEMVNRHKISASINTAKKNYFRALVSDYEKPDLGFAVDKFPPEKTIYLSLFKENNIGLSRQVNLKRNKVDEHHGFKKLWDVSGEFLNSAKNGRRKVEELYDLLGRRPYKLKKGLLDFWIPTFLFINREEFALFFEGGFIPKITPEIMESLAKYPSEYELKTFDVAGIKYDIFNSFRQLLNQATDVELTSSNFIETIKPFFTFYKGLPEYTKNTKRLSKETLAVRNVLINAKDPEKTFFEDFPEALNYNIEKLHSSNDDIAKFTQKLQFTIRELRTCYDELLNRFEEFILTEIIGESLSFEDYKLKLQNRFKKLKRHLLLKEQKVFIQRIDSLLNDRNAWLNSLGFALIGKSLEKITDDEEVQIFDKLKEMILDLDSLTEISKDDFSEEKEKVVRLEVNSFNSGKFNKTIRIPIKKTQSIRGIEQEIKKRLSSDKSSNISALINILNEILSNE